MPKKGNPKECSNYPTIALMSHTSKVMLKILQARLQQYMNCELPDVQAGFRKGRGTRDQNCQHPLDHQKSKRVPEKHLYFCFIDYAKAFDCVDHNKLWKILKEMGIPDHLTYLLNTIRNNNRCIQPCFFKRSFLNKKEKNSYCNIPLPSVIQ